MPTSQWASRPPALKLPSTDAATRWVRDSRRTRRPGPRASERPAVEVPGRFRRARARRIGVRLPGVRVAERLPARMVGRHLHEVLLEVETGPYDGVVYQCGIAASAQQPLGRQPVPRPLAQMSTAVTSGVWPKVSSE